MKKWGWKKLSAMGMALSLALSSTAFAAGTASEGVEQTETGTEAETEKKENGLENHIFAVEQDLKEQKFEETESEDPESEKVRKITLEELEEIEKNSVLEDGSVNEMPQTAVILFQKEGFWNQEEIPEEMTETEGMIEKQSVEMVLETTAQETEAGAKTEKNMESEEEYPVVTLSEEQEEMVEKTASLVDETIVVINGGTLEDELMFQEEKNVKAVLFMNEKTEEAFREAIENMEFTQAYADYQKKIEEKAEETEKKADKKTVLKVETEKNQVESVLPGTTLAKANESSSTEPSAQTPSTQGTEKNTEMPGTSRNTTSGTGTGSSTQTSQSSTAKEIKIDMVPDPLEEGDDVLYALYKITCPDDVKITEASFKLTYDSTKMSYDKDYSDAGEDIFDDFTYTGTDNVGSVTINVKANSGTDKGMKDTVLDLGFELKQEAKVGDLYNLKLEVTSMKASGTEISGNSNYKITINEESVKAMAYSDDDEGDGTEQMETQPQTQTQTQTETQTQAQTQSLQKAAKTDDATDAALWIMLLAASAAIFGNAVFRKKKA